MPAPRKPDSLAYVLSQAADMSWMVIFRSGSSRLVAPDPARPDYEAGGPDAALTLMQGIAEDRERFAEALGGDHYRLFLAVPAAELTTYGVVLPPPSVAGGGHR